MSNGNFSVALKSYRQMDTIFEKFDSIGFKWSTFRSDTNLEDSLIDINYYYYSC